MRGKGGKTLDAVDLIGITPAYAGKRRATPLNRFQQWDHPRLCGEKVIGGVSCVTTWGSPPPMRGKVFEDDGAGKVIGITPAYAGKSRSCRIACLMYRDHPRLCGEKFRFLEISPAHEGSPPPMRGKVYVNVNSWGGTGITPAYAGKSKF